MTQRMLDMIRLFVQQAGIVGPVLEFGSYIEANQDHLNMRGAFPPGTEYVGVDVIDGPGVDRKVDLLDVAQVEQAGVEVSPGVVLCLYVLEHVWDIARATRALCDLWRSRENSWIFVATHQNQPFHGTEKYSDYWRLTIPGMRKLLSESGISDSRVFFYSVEQNPEDILAIRQPVSQSWPGEAMSRAIDYLDGVSVGWGQVREEAE